MGNRFEYGRRVFVLVALILMQAFSLTAQNRAISGKVTDENGDAVAGATVVIPGTSTGTVSGDKGEFRLNISPQTKTFVVSFLGYTPRTVTIGNKTRFEIVLESSSNVMDSVVVVGYGTMRKSDLTGAVSSIKPNEIEAASSASLQSLLQGRVAGVQVTAGDAAPGAAVNIKIRGTGSLTGNSSPLYVVDGVIMNNEDTPTGGQGNSNADRAGQNGLTGISPQDIATMEILKDASATAIYGSLGANGVVLITTKSGQSATPKVQFSGSYSISEFVRERDMMNFQEYSDYMTAYTTGYDPENKIGKNWQREVTQLANSFNARLNVSGKSDKTTYYLAGGIMDNQGVVKSTSYLQADLRVNLEQILSRSVTIGTRSSFMYTKNRMTQGSDRYSNNQSGLIRQMTTYRPYMSTIGNSDDIDIGEEGNTGPQAWIDDYSDFSNDYRIISSLYLNVKLCKWLSMKTSLGLDFRDKSRQQWWGMQLWLGQQYQGIATVSGLNGLRYTIDHMFNFNYKHAKHRLSGTVGVSAISTQNSKNIASSSQFNGNVFFHEEGLIYGTAPAAITAGNAGRDKVNSLSFLARVIYNFDERFILTSTFRADGTSKFAPGNKFAYFPSFALAYRMGQEPFIRRLGFVSNLKWRIGWGQVGSQAISAYQTLANYNSQSYTTADGGRELGLYPQNIPNPDLKWETTDQINVGLDLGLFDNRITFTADVYDKMSRDLLQSIDIPVSTGFSSKSVNQGKIRNRGLELAADLVPLQTKNLTVKVGGNISFNRNKIVDIGLPAGTFGSYTFPAKLGGKIGNATYFNQPANIFIEGRPVALFWGYKVNGIVKQADYDADQAARAAWVAEHGGSLIDAKGTLPVYSGPSGKTMLVPGDPKYVDISKDGTLDATDVTIIGNPNPDFNYGFSLDVSYKNFYMSAVFNGVHGNDIANGNRLSEEDLRSTGNNYNKTRHAYYNMWTPERGDAATYPRYNYNGQAGDFTSSIVEDGSFLRFAVLTVGYDFRFKKKKPVSNINVSFTARNIFVWTDYSGYDPEVSSFTNVWNKVGVDWASYPNNRSYVIGVSVNF